jgi:molecular chaperone HtpG
MKGVPPMDSGSATFAFQAEIKQLLRLMVHSLYSNREIFLRELVSNASDANDRLRFEALARPELAAGSELEIRIEIDADQRLLSITDNGIGMSRDEVIEHLGTIARSGTGQFLERLTGDQRKDAQLIGQFGVGFYSAFIVAEEVTVLSRRADALPEQGVRWVSAGQGEYSVATVSRAERGTTVQLKLKPDAAEFLAPYRLRELVRKYSDHIAFPVRMQAEGEAAGLETVNRAKALWSRSRTEIKDDEYVEFYKHIAHDSEGPLTWSHNRVEGKREYTSLLYVPSVAPFDLWNRESPKGVKLYVQRVFITDQATQFLPLYLRFVRGVVDSSELSLNVSRELLQQDEAIAAMRSALTRRVLDMLERLAEENKEKYATFWGEFGPLLKEGVVEDAANRDKLAKLLRFNTTRSAGKEQDRSLKDYLADAKPEQKAIYFLVAESPTAARSSPHLETFREGGIEVLLLSDRLDEWVMQHLTEHEGKPFKDVRRGVLDATELGGDKPVQAEHKDGKALLKRVKRALRERVEEVRVGQRLKQSAACLVLSEHDLGYQMRELLAAAGHAPPPSVPSLELNLEHPLVRRLDAETDDARFDRLALLLFEQAVLAEGRQLDDPAAFVTRLNELLTELSPQH